MEFKIPTCNIILREIFLKSQSKMARFSGSFSKSICRSVTRGIQVI